MLHHPVIEALGTSLLTECDASPWPWGSTSEVGLHPNLCQWMRQGRDRPCPDTRFSQCHGDP